MQNPYLEAEWMEGNVICLQHYGRVDRFEIVNTVPDGYVPWLIPRSTFSDKRVIPLCQVVCENIINPKTLKAYYCKDSETADRVIDAAHKRYKGNENKWRELITEGGSK